MRTAMTRTTTLLLALAGVLTACGGGDSVSGPPGTGSTPAVMAVSAGDGQVVPAGSALNPAPAVKVTDSNGQPVANVTVNFTVTAGGGSVTGASPKTSAQGIATVGGWTLGATAGVNQLKASIPGSAVTPVTFTATATQTGGNRKWTVMVYMAADNNLAVQGIQDIDEMESAGTNPAVQVVVQAEFSPTTLQQYQCDASCFNRPNFNTFRYAITGQGAATTGPNGAATDIGNRDMTSPTELHDFVAWAKQTYPADHYMLVLWNHGGGYVGLLQDETSAGSGLMSLDGLHTALTGVGGLDIVDFDMCLMAGYETLSKLVGLTQYAVFSEETVPGEGNPYQALLQGLQANATATPRAVAGMIADKFHASYQGNRASTTVSAYELAGFAGFESSLNALAGTLDASLGAIATDVGAAAAGSQKYDIPELTDLVNLLDSLSVRIPDATIQTEIAAVRAQATGTFRITSHARTGTGQGAANVDRSTGLNIVMPSGVGQDVMGNSGPRSLAAYQALNPGKPWTQFLTHFMGGQNTTNVTDQGNARFESYLVWDPNAVQADADVDLWVLEPNGNVYVPAVGSVTPNGTFSNDSYADGNYFEGYLTNRYVQNGTYKIYANLWRDPQDYEPLYDLAYRMDQASGFTSLFGQAAPRLSLTTSWLNDPNATFQQVEAGAYTDLQYVAVITFGPAPAPLRAGAGAMTASSLRGNGPSVTTAQMQTLRRLAVERRSKLTSPRAGRITPQFKAPGSGSR